MSSYVLPPPTASGDPANSAVEPMKMVGAPAGSLNSRRCIKPPSSPGDDFCMAVSNADLAPPRPIVAARTLASTELRACAQRGVAGTT